MADFDLARGKIWRGKKNYHGPPIGTPIIRRDEKTKLDPVEDVAEEAAAAEAIRLVAEYIQRELKMINAKKTIEYYKNVDKDRVNMWFDLAHQMPDCPHEK